MLARLTTSMPVGGDWIVERKYDGFRAFAVCHSAQVTLLSRNMNSLERLFPSVAKAVSELFNQVKRTCILDGEIVIEDEKGHAHFQFLAGGEPLPTHLKICFYVFDILYLDGHGLHDFELQERKELLFLLLKPVNSKVIRRVESLDFNPSDLMKQIEKKFWEGVLFKDDTSRYHSGKRSSQWLKFKRRQSQEAVVCGFTQGQGSRSYFGALVLGVHGEEGLRYLGKCGTGFTDAQLEQIYKKINKRTRKTSPFPDRIDVHKEAQVTWVTPKIVCEVYFTEWTHDGHFRHPVFKGLRPEKNPQDITLERPYNRHQKEKTIHLDRRQLTLTSLDKLYWPKDDITKGQLLDHYLYFADRMLPYIKDKPLSMHRFPEGIEKQGFFHKDFEIRDPPSWLKTEPIRSKSTGENVDYIICNHAAVLLYVVNLGSIEINSWLSTYRKQDFPEFMVLDLDPNGASMQTLIEVALTAKNILDQTGVKSYIKTSGSTGFHICLYLHGQHHYDIARDFIQLIAELVHEEHPNTTSVVRDPKKRKGKVYLDFLQNRRGQTIVAPYSVRPKPGAPVSTPLHWEEVRPDLSIQDYHLFNMVDRVRKIVDPWKDFFEHPVDLKAALKAL